MNGLRRYLILLLATTVLANGGLAESELPETFERDDYRVLLVAEKYQTGFDQPLLQTMYVVRPTH